MDIMDIDEISDNFNTISINEDNDIISYIKTLNIDNLIKKTIIELLYNDNYNSYLDIYNICLENDIELPPI